MGTQPDRTETLILPLTAFLLPPHTDGTLGPFLYLLPHLFRGPRNRTVLGTLGLFSKKSAKPPIFSPTTWARLHYLPLGLYPFGLGAFYFWGPFWAEPFLGPGGTLHTLPKPGTGWEPPYQNFGGTPDRVLENPTGPFYRTGTFLGLTFGGTGDETPEPPGPYRGLYQVIPLFPGPFWGDPLGPVWDRGTPHPTKKGTLSLGLI